VIHRGSTFLEKKLSDKAVTLNTNPHSNKPVYIQWTLLIALLLFGIGLRLVDLTDPPLDFHPTRQLRAAIIARGMYYEMAPSTDPVVTTKAMQLRAALESYEPQIFERLTALSYLVTGSETLWTARLFALLFWCIGGVFLFDLARRMVSWEGGLVALAYYLLLPLAVQASRSFQPDPLVTLWIILSLWTAYRWSQNRTWGWGLATGIVAGLTLLIKITALFFLAPAVTLLVLDIWGLRKVFRRWEVWAAFVFAVLIPGSFYIAQKGQSAMNYIGFWTGSFYNLWMEPAFYVQWLKTLDRLFNLVLLVAGLAGTALFHTRGERNALLGMWLGYGVYGLYFPYQIRTHEYYSLMFVPVVALSLAPLGQLLLQVLRSRPLFWRIVSAAAVLVGIAYPVWVTYTGLIGVNYSAEATAWRKMGEELPQDGQIIALTHDYGYRISYYGWRQVLIWPTTDELEMLSQRASSNNGGAEDFEQLFLAKTQGMDYFLITRFDQLEAQPSLRAYLYDHYPIMATGDGYLLFDLRSSSP
jgi:4-amino-4-deoxy-L-arabinose transferase-like glycosyltransferase